MQGRTTRVLVGNREVDTKDLRYKVVLEILTFILAGLSEGLKSSSKGLDRPKCRPKRSEMHINRFPVPKTSTTKRFVKIDPYQSLRYWHFYFRDSPKALNWPKKA